MPTITELEVCETYIEKLLAGVDTLLTLHPDLGLDKALVVDNLIERVLTLVDLHTRNNTVGSPEELKSVPRSDDSL